MENWEPSALAEAIAERIFVELEASGRHVHMTAQQALVLFGHPLTPKRPLSQPGQYLSNERVTAKRHIHLTPEDAARFGVRDRQTVKLKAYTARPVIFEDVAVRVSPEFASYVHLDYDEANACGFQKGDLGRILP